MGQTKRERCKGRKTLNVGPTKKEMQRERCKGNDEKKEKQTMSNLLNEARFRKRDKHSQTDKERDERGTDKRSETDKKMKKERDEQSKTDN